MRLKFTIVAIAAGLSAAAGIAAPADAQPRHGPYRHDAGFDHGRRWHHRAEHRHDRAWRRHAEFRRHHRGYYGHHG